MSGFARFLPGSMALLAFCGLALAPRIASAQVLGTSVTGNLTFAGGSINYFDPANGFVPNGDLNKTQGTTVTIAEPGVEFGFQDGANLDTANFTDTQLIVTDVVSTINGTAPFQMTFTDSAFTSLSKVSDSFPSAGITSMLAGDQITLNFAGTSNPGTYTATFDLTASVAAVPEPGSVAMLLGMGLTGAGFLIRRRKK